MTANGIMRVSDIQREIDGIVKEIAAEGSGTYTGRAAGMPGSSSSSSSPPPSRRGGTRVLTTTNLNNNATVVGAKPPASRDSNVNDFRNTGFDFFNRIPPPETETSVARGQGPRARQFPPERYYSESVYPVDLEYYTTTTTQQQRPDAADDDDGARDYGEERISKYGEKRFGVVTPRSGVTPTTSGNSGWRESGRPF